MEHKPFTKGERIAKMAEQEAKMTRNPITGEIPANKLYEIRQEIIKSGRIAESRAGDEWTSRGPNNVGGRTRGILVDKRDPTNNTLFVGSVSGGIWKVTNASSTPSWTRLEYSGSPSVTTIVQDPNDLNTLYLGTGEGWFSSDAYRGDGIYKSTNGGDSWARLEATNNSGFVFIQKLLFTTEGNLLASTRDDGLQMTIDGGNTWARVLGNGNQGFSNRAADIEVTSDGTIFASMGIFAQDGLYRSTDGGFQWKFLELEIDDYERIEIGTSQNDPDLIMALVEDGNPDNRNRCKTILKSTDKGETWVAKNGGFGFLNSFANEQAWYDLSIAIDPNNSDVVFIGGLNIHRTTNGGTSWIQMSSGSTSDGTKYAHVDQHFAQFMDGSSDNMYFGNDGGLWLTQNASSSSPTFKDLSQGYISTQFYACDIHPEAENDFFIAGAQDNGSIWLNKPGLDDGVDVLGGDGAYCHINQINPNFMVVSTQFGGFRATTNGNFNSLDSYFQPGGEEIAFINPTDMDDVNNFLYSGHLEGEFYRTNLVTKAAAAIKISQIFSDQVSAVEVDPNDSDLLYLGTDGGNIVRVTNPRSANPSGELLRNGSGYVRSVNVDPLDSDRILATYSNFGVESVYFSEDQGGTWTSIEGDLPDMPVRWGVFSPADNKEVILGTELGVWQATIDGASTNWTNISPEIGLARVDMIKYRKSDLELLAGTYGKGLYTTSRFAVPSISFNNNNFAIAPIGEYDEDYCNLVESRLFTISTPIPFDVDANITLILNASSTAIEGEDYVIEVTELIIPAGEKSVSFEILIFNNAIVDGDKLLDITLEADQDVLRDNLKINILENDEVFSIQGTSTDVVIGGGGLEGGNIFQGYWGNTRTQILYSTKVIDETELNAGLIGEITFDVIKKGSSAPFQNFTISIGEVSNSEIEDQEFIEDGNLTMVYSGSVTTELGLNRITFDTPWEYSGVNNILIEFCYDNSGTTDDDKIASSVADYTALLTQFADNQNGCTTTGSKKDAQQLPNILLTNIGPKDIYNQTEVIFASPLGAGETAYFASSDSLICSVENLSGDETCLETSLLSNSGTMNTEYNMLYIDRMYLFGNEDEEQDLSITIFMPKDGSEEWFSNDIKGLYTEDAPVDGEQIGWQYLDITLVESNTKYISFTMPYVGNGIYTVGQEMFSSANDIEFDESYDQVVIFDLTGRMVSGTENISDNMPTGIYVQSYLRKGAIVFSKKIFVD
ncbi:MAG: photosystem II stability/assembly factor-like uncharacterized protein [Halioglobus sp.]|jgi:photosystem II stability/assembly factor-like uncharacterized protein